MIMTDPTKLAAADDEDEADKPDERYMFQKTDLGQNNNKYYIYSVWAQPLGMLRVKTEFGRVGANSPQGWEKVLNRTELQALMHEREYKKGYKPVDLHTPEVVLKDEEESDTAAAPKPAPTDSKVVQLVQWIFSEAGEHIQTYLATKVEALSQRQIQEARNILQSAQTLWRTISSSRVDYREPGLTRLVQDYYNAIPTQLPPRIDIESVVRAFTATFSEQEDRLNQLEAAIATMKVQRAHPGFSQLQSLDASISTLDSESDAYKSLVEYVKRTVVHGYSINIKDIFEIEIPVEREAYMGDTRGKSKKDLLFHGTYNRNIRHILRSGLICPRTASNGRMLGNGIYFANKASKSTNYCNSSSYQIPQMLFVAEVALGKMYTAHNADPYSNEPPAGYDSVFGKANYTKSSYLTLMNDEFVVYRPSQQTIRFMITFTR